MIAKAVLISASICTVCSASIRSGMAAADWITASETCEPGKPVRTAIRLVIDEHWHTYWENPGDSGMKISVTWDLPAGWQAGELEHPVPGRFQTGELPSFGYEGTVVFPVALTPPADFAGTAKLRGKISWLTCNADKCVPGNAGLELPLRAGPPAATEAAKWIDEALKKIPRPLPGLTLHVTEKPETLLLSLTANPSETFRPNHYEIFPATPEVVDAAAKFNFTSTGNSWDAEVPKSDYAVAPVKKLALVLAGKAGRAPISLSWMACQKPE